MTRRELVELTPVHPEIRTPRPAPGERLEIDIAATPKRHVLRWRLLRDDGSDETLAQGRISAHRTHRYADIKRRHLLSAIARLKERD